MKLNKTQAKWADRIRNHATPWTEQEIIFFRKFVGHSGTKDREFAKTLIEQFVQECDLKGFNITPEQTAKGINYLLKITFKKNGEVRNSKKMPFGLFEQGVLKDFYEFKFVGIYNASDNAYPFYLPIYRVIATDGSWFEYSAGMWGNIEVLNISYAKPKSKKRCGIT